MAEISNLLSHFNAMCDNIWVKSAEGYNLLGAFESALYRSSHAVTLYFQSGDCQKEIDYNYFNSKKER